MAKNKQIMEEFSKEETDVLNSHLQSLNMDFAKMSSLKDNFSLDALDSFAFDST